MNTGTGKEIFKIMEKNQIIEEVEDRKFLFNKSFFAIVRSNVLKYESVLYAIILSIKSYLPESQTTEIALACVFVMTIMQKGYPDIAKEALDELESVDISQISPALNSIFDSSNSSEQFLPQSVDEILMAIKKYEGWK